MATLPTADSDDAVWAGKLNGWLDVFFRDNGSPRFSWAKVAYNSTDDNYDIRFSNNILSLQNESFSNGTINLEFTSPISDTSSVFIATCDYETEAIRMASVSNISTTGCTVYIRNASGTLKDSGFSIFVMEQ